LAQTGVFFYLSSGDYVAFDVLPLCRVLDVSSLKALGSLVDNEISFPLLRKKMLQLNSVNPDVKKKLSCIKS